MAERYPSDPTPSRRGFFHAAGGGLVAATTGLAASPDGPGAPVAKPVDLPPSVHLPPFNAGTERESEGPPRSLAPAERVGYAIVGLGRLSLAEILPAFGESRRSKLVALVSGDRAKAEQVGRQYGIGPKGLYDYANFDQIRDNPEIDAVYVVLPNSMHLEYTIRSARAGKHVLCEKPMANTSAECAEMIAACKRADRRLMIAYRCQFEPYNRAVTAMVRDRALGMPRVITAENCQNIGDPSQWRLKKALAGGGSLPDIGIYCLNAARVLTGEEPVEISARIVSPPGDPRFAEVEDRVAFELAFPSGVLASCLTGYSSHESRRLRVGFDAGWADLEAAFAYRGQRLRVARAEGKVEVVAERLIGVKNQFALELDHLSDCLVSGRAPRTPGEEGLQDQLLMEAIYESAREGRVVRRPPSGRLDSTRGPALNPS